MVIGGSALAAAASASRSNASSAAAGPASTAAANSAAIEAPAFRHCVCIFVSSMARPFRLAFTSRS